MAFMVLDNLDPLLALRVQASPPIMPQLLGLALRGLHRYQNSCVRSAAGIGLVIKATLSWPHAGRSLPQIPWLLAVAKAFTSLGGAYAPLAVELFCGGALGLWLRLAQRLVASKPPAEREDIAARLLTDGLVPMVQAFGLVVPQARAHPLASTCCTSSL